MKATAAQIVSSIVLLSELLAHQAASAADVPKSGSIAYLDQKSGFREARFGSTPLPDMKKSEFEPLPEGIKSPERPILYTRPNDQMNLGDWKLEGIDYGFVDTRLAEVVLFGGGDCLHVVLPLLRTTWGKETRTWLEGEGSTVSQRWEWKGTRVTARLNALSLGSFCNLDMYAPKFFEPIHEREVQQRRRVQEQEQERNRKAAETQF